MRIADGKRELAKSLKKKSRDKIGSIRETLLKI
jgi:hypothetical protein